MACTVQKSTRLLCAPKNDENDTNVVDVDSTNSVSDEEVETRVDLVAFGVRYAANQIRTHAVCIRDGRLDAP